MADTRERGQKGTMGASSGPQNLSLNTHKAGMEGLDTEKINEIIKRASEGSRFYQHKQKHQQQLTEKLEVMKKEAASFTKEQIEKATKQMDQLVQELEAERDLSRTIVHVDMDMFYAAVEMRDDPSLRDKPMAVGSTGMLSTSNYAARKFGVRAAMPGFIGKKLCPELIIVPPNFTKYKAVSRDVREVFSQYDPGFSPMSLDEAYLDITEFLQKNSSIYEDDGDNHEQVAQAVVSEMRHKIEEKTSLTASAGIAANTRLAKVCSDLNKPNGQYYLPPDRDRILHFISTLPIRKVSGIGNVMEQHLQALDITQCSHLMEKRGLIKLLFSETSYDNFLTIALGLGHSTLSAWTERDRKSISTETTFKGTSDRPTLFKLCADLCQELADEMQEKDIVGKVLTLKLKTTDFQLKTRGQTLSEVTRCPKVMAAGIKRLLLYEMNALTEQPLSLRLLGVRMSSLLSASEVGQKRQATLTQMFSQAPQKASSSNTFSQIEQEPHKSQREMFMGNVETKLDNTLVESSLPVTVRTNISQKKNMSIENFLLSKPKPSKLTEKATFTEEYECSVCEQLIHVECLEEFNQHLDTCLEMHSSPPLGISGTDNSSSFKTDTDIQKNSGTSAGYEEIREDTETLSNNSHMNNYESNLSPSTSSVKQDLLCPVCEQSSFNDIARLNKHMDECLNRSAINELLQESSHQREAVRHLDTDTSKNQTSRKRKGNAESCISKKTKSGFNTLDKYFCS